MTTADIRQTEARSFPFGREHVTKLPSIYGQLRASEPVSAILLPSGDTGYLVSRYDDARLVLSDPRFSRAATIAPGAPRLTPVDFPAGSLFTLDPPEHTRLRKLVAGAFTERRVQSLLPRIQQITDELLNACDTVGEEVELNQALAFPLPIMVICELLGVPHEERERFRVWSDAVVSLTAHTADQVVARQREMAGYMANLIERKRVEGGDDLLSALITAHDEQGALGTNELIVMAMTLLVAGHETTVSMIGTSVLTLLRHPETVHRLLEDEGYVAPLVEELLRLNPIGDGGPLRIALEDVEMAGVVIPKGSAVMAAIGSANMDSSRFEQPEALTAEREVNPHLAFGHGIHRCLGAALARAELRIAIRSLFMRFPTLRLAKPIDELRMKPGLLVNSLESLPVTW
ncbi:cytochrome P450 [Streptomyces roseifaciens]|uniref:cytochrome P450 n=1 Tax=Streptomyces roseifaciens TaxID=1488406 RepID=UPI000718281F|nr:cytochrome P450 [Streptomyces roseifaciens]